MPRKGFEKVRSGCITCKARKVKCDEARPECARCKASGRVCAGYRNPPPGSFSWIKLLKRPSTISYSNSTNTEFRGLDFFRCIVAPALTSPIDNSFWTRPVFQLAFQEPAARYAVLAISSLYEGFDPFSYGSSLLNKQSVAVSYYNKALRQVATSKHLDADTVLFISVLFTCVEFLRGNAIAAIEHCRHGIHILRSMEHAPYGMSALFHHLSIFPFFFGVAPSDFPLPPNPKYPSNHIQDLPQAAETLDCLMSSSARLLRAFDPYRLGVLNATETPSSLTRMQHELCRGLDTWHTKFSTFIENSELSDENQALLRVLEMRWNVCKIWVHIASDQDETASDKFRDQFERIVELAREDATSRGPSGPETPRIFKFEMGSTPLLHFVVLKCRFLQLRIEASELLRDLSYTRESLWDAALMYAIGNRIMEREHGIELPPRSNVKGLEHAQLYYTLPSDNQRIRDSYLQDETQLYVDCRGSRMTRRRITLFMRHEVHGKVERVRDWIYLLEKS